MSEQSPNPGAAAGGSEAAPGSPGADPGPVSPTNYSTQSPVKEAKPCQYPPYPEYSTEPQQASVQEVISGGRTIRYQYKSRPPRPSKAPPKPALPRGPKVTDVKLTRRQYIAHARCLRRHGNVLTDRLEHMARPPRRRIIYMWRDYAGLLPAETIARFRNMLDADVPFKPDQAYQYFMNLKRSKKKPKCPTPLQKSSKLKKLDVYGDKKCEWARNATVAFARGIQHKLGRPGCYSLEDGMLNLSNIVMCEIAKFIHMKPVHRHCTHPKAKFLMELSDKIAVWIDQVMLESDERMLMMDVDEDDEVMAMYAAGGGGPGGDQFTDDFLDMMGGKKKGRFDKDTNPAYLQFKGEMRDAFNILTKEMDAKGDEQLLEYGKHKETYKSGANELRRTPDFTAMNYDLKLANDVKGKMKNITDAKTPEKIKPYMKDMIDLCGNYLAQHAEYNKDKGPAFKLLVKKMKEKGNKPLYTRKNNIKRYSTAANDLEEAKGLDHEWDDDPELTKKIHSELQETVSQHTPPELKEEMQDVVDKSAKYLSQRALHDEQRGEAFDFLIKQLEKKGGKPFTPEFKELETNFLAAYVLKSAPRLDLSGADPTLVPKFQKALNDAALVETPKELQEEMKNVIRMSSNYLAVYIKDRGRALQSLITHMKGLGDEELVRRAKYGMSYGKGAQEVEEAPGIVPYLPVKDISDEVRTKLTEGMKDKTPPGLEAATKTLVRDVAGHLSQPVALRSGVAGERYPVDYLANVKESLGDRKLYEHKDYAQTYEEAAGDLKTAGKLQATSRHHELAAAISREMKEGVGTRVGPGIHKDLGGTMSEASKHLAKLGGDRGEVLEHLVKEMEKKGDEKLAKMQGYEQTYKDAVERIRETDTLKNDKVDKPAYEVVSKKLDKLMSEKPPPDNQAMLMPEVVDDVSKFLAAPLPETKGEKRKVLARLMGKKKEEVLAKEGHYKMTFPEGGKKFVDAPYEISPVSMDPEKQKEVTRDVKSVIPAEAKPLQVALQETTVEAGSHLTDVTKGRAEALDVIHKGLKAEGDKELIKVGKFHATHAEGAKIIENAPHFEGGIAGPKVLEQVDKKLAELPKKGTTPLAEKHLKSTTKLASHHIASEATEKSGLSAKELGLSGEYDEKLAKKRAEHGIPSEPGGGSPLQTPVAPGTPAKDPSILKTVTPVASDPKDLSEPRLSKVQIATPPVQDPSIRDMTGAGKVPSKTGEIVTPGVEIVPSKTGEADASGVGKVPSKTGEVNASGVGKVPSKTGEVDASGVGKLPSKTGDVVAPGADKSKTGVDGFDAGGRAPAADGSDVGVKELKGVKSDASEKEQKAGKSDDGGGKISKSKGKKGGGIDDEDGGGWRTRSGDEDSGSGRGGRERPPRRGGDDLYGKKGRGRDDARKAERDRSAGRDKSADRAAAARARAAAADREDLMDDEDEDLHPDSCPCEIAAAHVKRKHARKMRRQAIQQQNKNEALDLLRKELSAKGDALLYQSPNPFTLTNQQASEWLGTSMKVEPSVKTSSDVTRLQAKFEQKLFDLMDGKYPDRMEYAMQDCIIESARKLAEIFVTIDYQKSAKNAFISEMQKRGNTLLIDGETYFYAAQRLKKDSDLFEPEPCEQTSPYLQQELENTIVRRSIPRKMVGTMKGYTKNTADYLSTRVGKPDNEITAYCTLLDEMESQGDTELVNKDGIKVSHKEATEFLRQQVTNEDTINKPDRAVSDAVSHKLTELVNSSQPLKDCDQAAVNNVKARSANILSSYVTSQVEKTRALNSIIDAMDLQGDTVLLRHGPVVRTFGDGANRLRGQSSAQIQNYMSKSGPPDPVVVRKINVRLGNMTTDNDKKLDPDVMKDVNMYLAKSFTESHVSRVCQCRKSVPIQCELWCDEILRRVARPCCACGRCAPAPDGGGWRPPGAHVAACETRRDQRCAADQPADECPAYALHTIQYDHAATDRISRALLSKNIQPPTHDETSLLTEDDSFPTPNSATASNLFWMSGRSSITFTGPVKDSRSAEEKRDAGYEVSESTNSSSLTAYGTSEHTPPMFEEVVMTSEMGDWNAMLVSLMWNMQAWRHWIHDQIQRAMQYNANDLNNLPSWQKYESRVSTEALQWRQYNIFSRQLALKLSHRYKNKQIVSPTRDTNKTQEYLECQSEMIDMIGMFKKWTHWLSLVVTETNNLKVPESTTESTLNKLRWNHFCYKLQERAADWRKYDLYFEQCWKESTLKKIPGWVPGWQQRAVWVVSAAGAVPSGAVRCDRPAPAHTAEPAWLARTTHRCQVLPGALVPSKHCCIVYADEKVFQYTKYQVLCNAEVSWVAWRSGGVCARAVHVGARTFAGRATYKRRQLVGPVLPPHYRCHVVINGRPFALNAFELLVLLIWILESKLLNY